MSNLFTFMRSYIRVAVTITALFVASTAAAQNLPCNPQAQEPVPEPGGYCDIEVIFEGVKADEGQGASEGTMEMDVVASADGKSLRWPSSGTENFEKGQNKLVNEVVETYRLQNGEVRQIELCATFTEDDNGGTNGDDDVGRKCKSVQIQCPIKTSPVSLSADLCHLDKNGNCKSTNGAYTAKFSLMMADADDGVANTVDWTPDICDEANKGQLGRASFTYLHYGDGAFTDLAQHLGTNLSNAQVGYDFTVLVMLPRKFAGFFVDRAAINNADILLDPTDPNFYLGLREITRRGYDMDIYLHSHGHLDGTDGADFETLDDDDPITDTELVERLAPELIGTPAVPIRMVYSGACYHGNFDAAWRSVGAKVVSGTWSINFYPNFYGNFADAWNAGDDYATSVAVSETTSARTSAQSFIEVQAASFVCDDDPSGDYWVLGTNACSENFFTDTDGEGPDEAGYKLNDDYDPNLSGLENMNNASIRWIAGDATIRKFMPLRLTW